MIQSVEQPYFIPRNYVDKMNYIENHYSNYDEDGRLGYKWGQVEFLTTMRYISKYMEQMPKAQVLEIGAGTGRYSRTIADIGYQVSAVEEG